MLRIISSFSTYTMMVALFISVISAYYSIVGLTAIFSAAVTSTIIMGVALELGKLAAAVWLKLNWRRAGWLYKMYLVPAVAFLMMLTSMGIFGYLSKAHSDHGLVSGDVQAKIALYDEKIRISRDNIESNRRALKQMDEAVDQVLGRSTTEQGAARSAQLRRQQTQERNRILKEIGEEQAKITKLNEESAEIRAQIRKVEAEVGPIRYIAALIYGDRADNTLLESAVRWVIIMIVIVFDPLALVLILAAQQSWRWEREEREKSQNPQYPPDDGPLSGDQVKQIQDGVPKPNIHEDDDSQISSLWVKPTPAIEPGLTDVQMDEIRGLIQSVTLTPTPVTIGGLTDGQMAEVKDAIGSVVVSVSPTPVHIDGLTSQQIEDIKKLVENISITTSPPPVTITGLTPQQSEEIRGLIAEVIDQLRSTVIVKSPTVDESPKDQVVDTVTPTPPQDNPTIQTLGVTKQLLIYEREGDYVSYEGKLTSPSALKEIRPDLVLALRGTENKPFQFGTQFPRQSQIGDMYMRVDVRPHRLYKFNGSEWIAVDKNNNQSYLADEDYVKYLMGALESFQYLPEMLTEVEEEVIRTILGN